MGPKQFSRCLFVVASCCYWCFFVCFTGAVGVVVGGAFYLSPPLSLPVYCVLPLPLSSDFGVPSSSSSVPLSPADPVEGRQALAPERAQPAERPEDGEVLEAGLRVAAVVEPRRQ